MTVMSVPDPVADSVHTNWYDAVGNRDSTRSTASGLVTGSYTTGNRITSFAGCTCQTDADGNRRCVIVPVRMSGITGSWSGVVLHAEQVVRVIQRAVGVGRPMVMLSACPLRQQVHPPAP